MSYEHVIRNRYVYLTRDPVQNVAHNYTVLVQKVMMIVEESCETTET